jgi:rod shape-determining protein MreD
MRSAAFLGAGLVLLLVVQGNLFRLLDHAHPGVVVIGAWLLAVVVDVARTVRQMRVAPGHPRPIATFRPDWSLPASVLLGYAILSSATQGHVGRPIPALVLPLILFMGVYEYSPVRGAVVAFVLGYVTDVLAAAPVGLFTFTYTATFCLARAAGVRLAAQTTWMQVLLVGGFAVLQSVMILVLLAIFGRNAWAPRSLLPLTVPHAIATASVAPIIFRIAQAIHTATAGAQRPEPGAGAAS